jgi:16S rRNA (uracil1498-N3)-methyltransferase
LHRLKSNGVITRRTIVSKIRDDRLQAQTIEAAEQCERLHIPKVFEDVSLPQLLNDWPRERILFVLDERGGALPIGQSLLNHAASAEKEDPCAILTGPEGGFDPSELDLLDKMPFVRRVSVGPRVLRADTAALAAISCWQSVLGDWQVPLRDRYEQE